LRISISTLIFTRRCNATCQGFCTRKCGRFITAGEFQRLIKPKTAKVALLRGKAIGKLLINIEPSAVNKPTWAV
jgi:hypothetical protein